MKKSLVLLILIIFTISCKKNDSFLINGHIKNVKQKYIYLSRVDINTVSLIDSSKINKQGNFRIRIKSKEPDFYQIGSSSKDFVTLLASPGEKIELSFNGDYLYNNYTVSGSKGTQKLQMLDLVLAETRRRLDSLSNLYTKESAEPGFDVKKPLLEAEYSKLLKAQRKMNIEFIINNLNSLASIKALYQRIYPETYVLNDQHDLQYLKIVTDSLTRHYPNSGQVQALARDFEKEMKQMYVSRISQIAKNLPETKLDPELKTIEGKKIALSSLKGKYVLLTFWSYQSKDCIAENLELKEYFKLFNKKGFEIYQINLDENESNWKAAVKFDELPWINTREDDPKYPKYAMMFNVQSVPANYLFDKETKIIASNLHGRELKLKLEQLFNN